MPEIDYSMDYDLAVACDAIRSALHTFNRYDLRGVVPPHRTSEPVESFLTAMLPNAVDLQRVAKRVRRRIQVEQRRRDRLSARALR